MLFCFPAILCLPTIRWPIPTQFAGFPASGMPAYALLHYTLTVHAFRCTFQNVEAEAEVVHWVSSQHGSSEKDRWYSDWPWWNCPRSYTWPTNALWTETYQSQATCDPLPQNQLDIIFQDFENCGPCWLVWCLNKDCIQEIIEAVAIWSC